MPKARRRKTAVWRAAPKRRARFARGVILLLLSGCGYGWIQSRQMFGHDTMAVMPFAEDQSMGMAPLMAHHLSQLLAADGLKITTHPQAAVLDGRISYSVVPSATAGGIQAYELNANVQAQLRESGGAVLWRRDTVVREDFLPVVGADVQPMLTETNRRFAMRRLAERSAQAIHQSLLVAAWVGR